MWLTKYHPMKTYPVLKHHYMKTYGGDGGIAPCILSLGTRWAGEWSASRPGHFTPRGTSPQHPLDRSLCGSQSRSGRGGEEKKSTPCPSQECHFKQAKFEVPKIWTSFFMLFIEMLTVQFSLWNNINQTFKFQSSNTDMLSWGPPSLLSSGYQGLFPWG
jgi:hypothetical protein